MRTRPRRLGWWAVLLLTPLAACVRKRTGLVVVVGTNMAQGELTPDAGAPPAMERRLVRLRARVYWGPTASPDVPALSDGYTIRIDRTIEVRADGFQQIRLPYPVFYLEPTDRDAMRRVRVEIDAFGQSSDGGAFEFRRPFLLETRFVDDLTYTQGVFIDEACVSVVCEEGLTCGPGGRCVPVVRDPPRYGDTAGGGLVRCDGGYCLPDDASIYGGEEATGACADAGPSCDAGAGDTGGAEGSASLPTCVFVGAPGCPSDGGMDADVDTTSQVPGMSPTLPDNSLDPPVDVSDGGLPTSDVPDAPPDSFEAIGAGGVCANLARAYTRRSVNVAYYPVRLLANVPFVYDFASLNRVFSPPDSPGAPGGVRAGTLIALASNADNYNSGSCQREDQGIVRCCGGASCPNGDSACRTDSPSVRGPRASRSEVTGEVSYWFWGYVVGPPMSDLGWFLLPPDSARYAGRDARSPLQETRGVSGNEFEAACAGSACADPTVRRATCAQRNPCDEGNLDCSFCQDTTCDRRMNPLATRATVVDPDPPSSEGRPGPYLRWAPESSAKAWLHWGDTVQVYYRNCLSTGNWWAFVELTGGTYQPARRFTPFSDGAGAARCNNAPGHRPWDCHPCQDNGTCGWIDADYLSPSIRGPNECCP